jgi:hypothetical protein
MYWYDEQGPQQLRAALQLPSWRFQSLIHSEPSILAYQPDTLQLTLQALCAALHLNIKTVVGVIEQRPGLLLQPHEAVQVLQQLSGLLGRTTQQTAFLVQPHPQLLAMPPLQLQQHIQRVCDVMDWPRTDSQPAPAAAARSPASFLQLLAMPVQQTAERIQALSTALDASTSVAAQLAQHHPALLNMSPAVLRSRLFAIAEADGSQCGELLAELDAQQLQGLSGLLLLSPGRLMAQLQGLQAVLGALQQQRRQVQQQAPVSRRLPDDSSSSCSRSSTGGGGGMTSSSGNAAERGWRELSRLSARLLLRLGTRVTLADVQVRLVMLQGAARTVQPWQQQLAAAGDRDLAVLLSASHESLAQAKYMAEAEHGIAEGAACTLLHVVSMPAAEFGSQYPGYRTWLAGPAG